MILSTHKNPKYQLGYEKIQKEKLFYCRNNLFIAINKKKKNFPFFLTYFFVSEIK